MAKCKVERYECGRLKRIAEMLERMNSQSGPGRFKDSDVLVKIWKRCC